VPANHQLKILFVLNPVSGGHSKAEWESSINNYFKNVPHTYELYLTNGENDKVSLTHWIHSWHPDRVVAVGGDGTLKLVAEVLEGTDIPLGVLPAGSANGMARELGLPNSVDSCLDIITGDNIRRIDAIRINDKDTCLHLSDIGLNAQLVKYFEENGWRGKLGYARGVLRVLLNKKMLHVRIETENESLIRDAFMVVLANARMYGTGAMINPKGNLEDGVFEVIIIRKLSFTAFLKIFLRTRNFNPDKIEILPAKSVTIEVKKKAYFQIDGEYKGKTRAIQATIKKQFLAIMLPPATS
jgi:diacylglycerol kinase (ATP)